MEQPDELLDRGVSDQQVDLVGQRVVDHRVAVVVDGDRAVPAVANCRDRERRTVELGDGFPCASAPEDRAMPETMTDGDHCAFWIRKPYRL